VRFGNQPLPFEGFPAAGVSGGMVLSGGASSQPGANMILHGDAHVAANDLVFRSGNQNRLQWDNSNNFWDFVAEEVPQPLDGILIHEGNIDMPIKHNPKVLGHAIYEAMTSGKGVAEVPGSKVEHVKHNIQFNVKIHDLTMKPLPLDKGYFVRKLLSLSGFDKGE
jgi:hypothetical protein